MVAGHLSLRRLISPPHAAKQRAAKRFRIRLRVRFVNCFFRFRSRALDRHSMKSEASFAWSRGPNTCHRRSSLARSCEDEEGWRMGWEVSGEGRGEEGRGCR